MEHFTPEEIVRILREFQRVLRSGGKILLFWPHARATSVFVLKIAHILIGRFGGEKKQFHPPEITHCRGKEHMRELLSACGFELEDYRFGYQDFFVQAVVVARKT